MENNQDVIARAYAMLSALRKNVDQIGAIPERYVRESHNVLDRMESSLGTDLSEFRIPSAEVVPHATSYNTSTGETHYSEEKYVERAFMLMKLDAVLGYFEIITSEEPRRIGFKK